MSLNTYWLINYEFVNRNNHFNVFKCVRVPGKRWKFKDVNNLKKTKTWLIKWTCTWLLVFVFLSLKTFQTADFIKAPLRDKNPISGYTFATDWNPNTFHILCSTMNKQKSFLFLFPYFDYSFVTFLKDFLFTQYCKLALTSLHLRDYFIQYNMMRTSGSGKHLWFGSLIAV